ncbi:hypothetical protein O181_015519 [Austropuccinia psidii MF-1]|uniref:Uncharacterized protein n=1 Tax=Austropuccinia psidii MF-1 TaxID=1389203 RepID=A0A9Q3C260_9BASI|nr:hypothetical protein [Austropuccinia psidii MF-1]
MGPGHEGEVMVRWNPGTLACGLILALGGSSNPHRPQTIGHTKDQKDPEGPKNTKSANKDPHHHSIKNGHSNGQHSKYSRGSKMAKNQFLGQISRTMGRSPLL